MKITEELWNEYAYDEDNGGKQKEVVKIGFNK